MYSEKMNYGSKNSTELMCLDGVDVFGYLFSAPPRAELWSHAKHTLKLSFRTDLTELCNTDCKVLCFN
jgi:hypothetical protein